MRYVTDIPYLPGVIPELVPEWVDFAATVCGFESPRRGRQPYRWCELGCGQGLTAIILAATHPDSRFVGLDLMPDHIESARRTAGAARLDNIDLMALDFAEAAERDWEPFDYIVAHGVYSWVDEAVQADLRRFVERTLAPGGLVYVSYNAMPGWAADAPFQYLLKSFAAAQPSASDVRVLAAGAKVEALLAAGAPALKQSGVARGWAEDYGKRPTAYLAHEYLVPAWRPRYVTEVREAMAAIGLRPVGSATLQDNFDSFVLTASAREAVNAIEDPDLRELARDYFINQRFRRDIFGRDVPAIADEERRTRLLDTRFALLRPAERVSYECATEAGTVRFDNPVARRIVSALADGPRTIRTCADAALPEGDLVANMLALASAGMVWPALGQPADTAAINAALLAEDPGEPTVHRLLRSGAPLRFARQFLADLDAGKELSEDAQPWADFLRADGR